MWRQQQHKAKRGKLEVKLNTNRWAFETGAFIHCVTSGGKISRFER